MISIDGCSELNARGFSRNESNAIAAKGKEKNKLLLYILGKNFSRSYSTSPVVRGAKTSSLKKLRKMYSYIYFQIWNDK